MSRTSFVKAATDRILELFHDHGVTIFCFDRIIEYTVPMQEFHREARRKIKRVMKNVCKQLDCELIPLTAFYFREHSPLDGSETGQYLEPVGEVDAKMSVVGLRVRTGKPAGFMIAGKNLLTGLWRLHHNDSAEKHAEAEIERSELLCRNVGFTDIPQLKRYTQSQLRRLTSEGGNGES